MATPSPSAIAQGRMEAIEAVKKVIPSSKGNHSLRLPTERCGKPDELSLTQFREDGEEERRVRSNELCKLLAKRPELMSSFNSLSAVQQLLTLMLREIPDRDGSTVKEWFLRASDSQRQQVVQDVLGQEGARERLGHEVQLQNSEAFFLERENCGAPECLRVGRPREEEQKRS